MVVIREDMKKYKNPMNRILETFSKQTTTKTPPKEDISAKTSRISKDSRDDPEG